MKLYILFALLVSVALVRAQDLDDLDTDISEEFDEFNGGLTVESGEPLDLELPDEDDDDDDDDEDDEDDDDEDDEDDEILPTTAYPTKRRWPGYKCMLKAKKCLMNATDCEEHLTCYEEKSTCIQAAKKEQKPFMKKPSKMVCKTMFSKCMERAGSDCFKKYMCYTKKGFCYRSRGRAGHRKPCGHHFRPHHHRRRPHHHGRHPTMNPEMMKCKIQWRQCFMKADSCSERLQCMFDFHHCMNRSRPTGPPPTMSPDEDGEDMNVYRRRWNPKLMAKCKSEFKECIANSSSCPLKMRCFWRMKMCFKPHHRPHYGYKKKKMMLIKITGKKPYHKFGGQWGNREMGDRYGQTTGSHWGNRQMGRHSGETRRQWGGGTGGRYGQTRRWEKHGREMGRRIGETGRQWRNRGYKRVKKVFKPMEKKFKNMWERHLG